MILTWCEPSNPLEIYEHHKEFMAEGFLHQQHTQLGNNDLSFNDDIFNLALNDLQGRVLLMGGRELSKYGLPHPQTVDNDRFARVYRREIDYDQAEQQAQNIQTIPLLTTDQRQFMTAFVSWLMVMRVTYYFWMLLVIQVRHF